MNKETTLAEALAGTKRVDTSLAGMTAICKYAKKTEVTVLKWIMERGFPAKKLDGTWQSDKILIDNWLRRQIKQYPADAWLLQTR